MKVSRRTLRNNLIGWGAIGPICLYYTIFGVVPIGIVIYYGFFTDSLFGGMTYVGFDNYVRIFTDPVYYQPFLNTLLFSVFTVTFSIVFGLLFAKLMTVPIRGQAFYRTVYYVPVVISMAVVAQILNVWLSYNYGTVNNIIESFGGERINWYTSTFWMYFWIVLICIWKGLGASIILFIAGLLGISNDIYEAADIDGANSFNKFFKITLPQLRPIMVFVLITSIIGAFNIFEPVQLISSGGPNGTTNVLIYLIYNEAFQNGNFGMGSAVAVILLIILMLLTAVSMKFNKKD